MKRFSESTKWADPWFRTLPMESKCIWLWLLDNCDCAGIIEPDMDLAAFQIGATKPLASPYEALGDRVQKYGTKLFIPKFIAYQYGAELNVANTAHRGVIRRLELAKIPCPVSIVEKNNKAPCKPLQSLLQGAQDKDKDKDKETVTDKDSIKKKTDLQLRVEKLMNRRVTTSMDSSESRAYKSALPAIKQTSEDDWNLLEEYYRSDASFKRMSLATLLNNWNGEIEKARIYKQDGEKPRQMSFGMKPISRDDRHPNELKETIDISTLPVWDATKDA